MRLIDADALKKEVDNFQNCYNGWSDTYDKAYIIEAIDAAPTIEVPTWIPCSERMPEYLEEVLMSTFWGVRVGFRDHTERSGDFWNIIENDSTVAPHSVYAWMPLPKAYEETDHE